MSFFGIGGGISDSWNGVNKIQNAGHGCRHKRKSATIAVSLRFCLFLYVFVFLIHAVVPCLPAE